MKQWRKNSKITWSIPWFLRSCIYEEGVVPSQALQLLEKMLWWPTNFLFPSSMQCSAEWGTATELCTLLSLSDQYRSILFWHHPQIFFLLHLWSIVSPLDCGLLWCVCTEPVQWPCLMATAGSHNGVKTNKNNSNNTNINSLWDQSFHNISKDRRSHYSYMV